MVLNATAAAHAGGEPKQADRTPRARDAPEARQNGRPDRPDELAAPAPGPWHRTLTSIAHDHRNVLQQSKRVMESLSDAVGGVRAVFEEKAEAEKSQAAVMQALAVGTESLRQAKKRRLQAVAMDLKSSALPAAVNRSRRIFANAQARVSSAEDRLLEQGRESKAADKAMARIETRLARAEELRAQRLAQAEEVHRSFMNVSRATRDAQRQQTRFQDEVKRGAADVQGLIAKLRAALQNETERDEGPAAEHARESNHSGSVSVAWVSDAPSARNAGRSNRPTARAQRDEAAEEAEHGDARA